MKMQQSSFRHSTTEYDDINQSTVRATENGAYPHLTKRTSMVQSSMSPNPLPPLPNKSPSTRSIPTVPSSRQISDTAFLEKVLPVLDKVKFRR